MGTNFKIAEFVNIVNIAKASRWRYALVPYNKMNMQFVQIFDEIGLFARFKFDKYKNRQIRLYFKWGIYTSTFSKIELVSKPSRRVYWNLAVIAREVERSSQCLLIISTSEGLKLLTDCFKLRLGGEPIIKVYLK
jgi:ribosomal protein S8